MTPTLVSEKSAREYFGEMLVGAMAHQQAALGKAAEQYLVDLLARFIDATRLYEVGPSGERDELPLAMLLARALEGGQAERAAALRQLGDRALYVAGFFADSLGRKLVDRNYYIWMGGNAYGALATRPWPLRTLFEELGSKFPTIVELFSEVSDQAAVTSQRGLLKAYERWMRGGA